MHQRRRLQRLSRLLMGQLLPGQAPQFVIDQRQELAGRGRIAGFDLRQELCDVRHGPPSISGRPVAFTLWRSLFDAGSLGNRFAA